jgi:hypothetical protein
MGHSSVTTTRGYDRRKKDNNLPDDILQTVFGRKMRVPYPKNKITRSEAPVLGQKKRAGDGNRIFMIL